MTRIKPIEKSLIKAYLHFENNLQINLQPPNKYTSVMKFMNQINAKKDTWFQNYSHFKKKDPEPYHPVNNAIQQSTHTARPYNNNNYRNRGPTPAVYRPQYLPNRGNSLTSPPTALNITTTTPGTLQPQPQTYRPEAQVFYGAPQSPSDFNKTPATTHTPRSYGNTHDNDEDDEAQVYFMDHEHGCNVIGCPHHHEE